MEKKHGRYYRYDAEEVAKKFFFVAYLANSILFLTVFGMIIWTLVDIASGTVDLSLCLMRIIIVFIIYSVYCDWATSVHAQIINILYVDCDPEKLLKFDSIREKHIKKEEARMALLLRKAQVCLYMNGRYEEGFGYLKQVHFSKKKFMRELSLLSCHGYYAYEKRDREKFDLVKQDMERLPALMKYNEVQMKLYKKQMAFMRMRKLILEGKKDEAKVLINKLLSEEMTQSGSELNRVILHMRLAELDMEDGNKASAKPHLQYVISNGNTLGVVEDAKKMLQEMENC